PLPRALGSRRPLLEHLEEALEREVVGALRLRNLRTRDTIEAIGPRPAEYLRELLLRRHRTVILETEHLEHDGEAIRVAAGGDEVAPEEVQIVQALWVAMLLGRYDIDRSIGLLREP